MHIKWSLVTRLLLSGAHGAYARLEPNYTSPAGVKIFNPGNFFDVTGPWSLMSQAGNTLYIAGSHSLMFI